jgi:hypothetical protein
MMVALKRHVSCTLSKPLIHLMVVVMLTILLVRLPLSPLLHMPHQSATMCTTFSSGETTKAYDDVLCHAWSSSTRGGLRHAPHRRRRHRILLQRWTTPSPPACQRHQPTTPTTPTIAVLRQQQAPRLTCTQRSPQAHHSTLAKRAAVGVGVAALWWAATSCRLGRLQRSLVLG